jgi:hypothetical protein
MTTAAENPLIAPRQDSTQWYSGIEIVDSIAGLRSGIESGSWIESTIGGVSTGLDALGTVLDPLGSLASWGVGWLIEHVKPLSDALDWLAGDPDQISAYAQTWRNVAEHTARAATELRESIWRDVAEWAGPSAEAYRFHSAEHITAMGGIAEASNGIGSLVEGAGLLVAVVREIVRDLIADFVSVLAVRLPMWLAEAGLTLGLATPLVVSQVGSLVAKWVGRIAEFLSALVRSLRRLAPMLRQLDDLIRSLQDLLRRLARRDATNPTNPSDPSGPSGPRGPDADGDGRPDGLDPDGDGDGRLDDLDGDGRPDIPPPNADGDLTTRDMNSVFRYETDPNDPRNPFQPDAVRYLDEAELEETRVFARDGLLYRTDGTRLDTQATETFWSGEGRAIFVMDQHGNIYAHEQVRGQFHHSSFLGGQPVAAAGELRVVDGRLELVSDQSGHYRPTRAHTEQLLDNLRQQGVDLSDVATELQGS